MHSQSLALMTQLLSPAVPGLSVLDVGSRDVNGTFRPLCARLGLIYTGLDIEAGPNVDVVAPSPYDYPFETGTFDVVLSGSTMEHVAEIWRWIPELVRVLKTGGLLAITTHTAWELHRYPMDYWRIMPDGMALLFDLTGQLNDYIILTPNDADIGASARKIQKPDSV